MKFHFWPHLIQRFQYIFIVIFTIFTRFRLSAYRQWNWTDLQIFPWAVSSGKADALTQAHTHTTYLQIHIGIYTINCTKWNAFSFCYTSTIYIIFASETKENFFYVIILLPICFVAFNSWQQGSWREQHWCSGGWSFKPSPSLFDTPVLLQGSFAFSQGFTRRISKPLSLLLCQQFFSDHWSRLKVS